MGNKPFLLLFKPDLSLETGLSNDKRIYMYIVRYISAWVFLAVVLTSQVLMLSARPEQAIPSGGASMVFLVDLDRPVKLTSGIQSMTGEMILSIAEKCEDPMDAKAALSLRHLRSGIAKAHSLALCVEGDFEYFVLEADFTPAFMAKFRSQSSLRNFGAYPARASSFGKLWGDDTGSLKNGLLVMAPDGRLIFGDAESVTIALKTLASGDCYLPTYGVDTGVHCVMEPAALGLDEYAKLGARRLVMDYKVGAGGRESARFELKCNSSRDARLIRPKAVADYVTFYSPIILRMFKTEKPGLTLADVQEKLTEVMTREIKQVDNAVMLESKDDEFDMNPLQIRILVEEMIVNGFKAAK
jgi:hypothetical protein